MSGLLVKSTVVMKENLEETEPARPGHALAGAARRRRAHPGVRRAGPRRAVRGRGPLRPGRVRGPAADGRRWWRSSAACPAPSCPALRKRRVRSATRRARTEPLEEMPARSDVAADNPVPDAAVLGHADRQGHRARRLRRLPRRAGDLHGPVGAAGPRAATGRRTRSWSRPRAGRGCGCGWTGCRPRGCSRRPSSTATSRAIARATTWSCSTRGRRRACTGSRSRGSGGTGTCAWPTSSGRRTPARSTWSPSSW